MLVFLTGATGFVGSHVLKRLVAEGHGVRALVRDPGTTTPPPLHAQSPNPRVLGTPTPEPSTQVQYVTGDVVSAAGLDEGMQNCEAVIHLVGIIVETGKATFESVHHLGTRNVVEAAKRHGIRRFVHMSALGVRADGVSEYQTSKWKGEEAVRQSGIPFCILRPSLIFGPGSGFVSQMLDVMRKAPLFRPVPGNGRPLFRPVLVDDVANCFVQCLGNAGATNQTIELGGGDELSLDEILTEIASCAGIRKRAIHVPLPLMFVGAALAQTVLPRPPVTLGQLRMLREGSTCDIQPMMTIFGLTPIGFRAGLREYFVL